MVKQVENIPTEKTESLIHSVHEFLDYAWDDDMIETRRLLILLIEGFCSGELSDAIGTNERANVMGVWSRIMHLMEGFEKYREGIHRIRLVTLKK